MNNSERSIVEFFSKSDGRSCGYCKSSSSSCSHGMWAHSLNVHDYQSLIDRGWRRSGHYCYKPVMNETCCPAYTIKCDAVQFKLTRSQKKLLKRFNHYLATGEKMKGPSTVKYHDRNVTSDMPTLPCIPSTKTIDPDHKMEGESTTSESSSSKLKQDTQESASSIGHKSHEPKTSSSSQVTSSGEKVPSPNPLTSTAGSSKSKHLRIERRKQTLLSRGLSMDQVLATMQASKLRRATREKTLEDFIHVKLPDNAKHRLELRLVQSSPPSSLFKKTFNLVVDVYRRYQMSVHGSAPAKCNSEQFTRFLCNSPLQASKASTGGHGYGSFHQQYWLDGRLIAVGVIDILPLCVSSVYFFYDPDYSWLSLGTLSSLREIEFTRSLHRSLPELSSYYMGFYIHSCPKMRYKGNLRPSYLLCPEVYSWHFIQEARQLLDRSKYSRLNPDIEAKDKDCDVTLDQVLVLTGGKVMLYRQFKQMYDHDEEHPLVQEYASLVGQYCAYRMLLVQ
ncbi:arginyl-tRNA--protein transferase 1 isoform X4 [Diaphorina citri]|uniref:Arginyl-tRNA--protein transferase 1 n=1 Tax=Diaphorina citri TaxID=121845 RepID=A0A3Q0JBG8_DIACI|nr:arginyl-tRNA--protein transferase 1 isoform X4 [Diaphorina citri]